MSTVGSEAAGRSRTLPAVAGAVVAVLLVAALAVWLNDRGADGSAPVSGASSDGPTSSATATEEPTAPEPTEPALDPTPAADLAVDAGVPALVPDAFGDEVGVVSAASYDADSGLWQLTVTTDAGDVVVVRQHNGTAAALLSAYAPAATSGADVDLARWGLGTWATATTAEAGVLSRDLPGGGATISGPDVATATAVAKTMLTHENTRGGEQV